MLRDIINARLFSVADSIIKPLFIKGDVIVQTNHAAISRAEAFHFTKREIPLIYTSHPYLDLSSLHFPALILKNSIQCSHSNINAFLGKSKQTAILHNKPVVISDAPTIDYEVMRNVAALIRDRLVVSNVPLPGPMNAVHWGDTLSFASELSLDRRVVVFDVCSQSLGDSGDIIHIVFEDNDKLDVSPYDSVHRIYKCDDIFSPPGDLNTLFVKRIADVVGRLGSGKHLIVCIVAN